MPKKFSPVIRAEARFFGCVQFLHVNVWFRDKDELQKLIDALVELRDTVGDDHDHVHLQHYDLRPGCVNGLAEVNFYRPGRAVDEMEMDAIEEAFEWLGKAKRESSERDQPSSDRREA